MADLTARNRDIVARLAAGATLREVAKAYGLSQAMVSHINHVTGGRPLADARPLWPDDRIGALRKLWRQGLSCTEIAPRLGVSKDAVVGKARRLRLPIRVPQNARLNRTG
jgi:DNA-binding CsgD family transcriptional regulator